MHIAKQLSPFLCHLVKYLFGVFLFCICALKNWSNYLDHLEIYSSLAQEKVIREAALRSGVSQGVVKACWDAAGSVIKAWATEGHSVALPGLGTMRFGLSAKSVADVNDVKTSLIRTRRIVFTPSTDLKDELSNTSVIITCYDRDGKEVKRVTSADDGIIEDTNGEDSTGENDGGNTSGNNSGSGNSGSQSGNGGNTNGGSNSGGSNTGGNQSGSSNTGEPGDYRLNIFKYGSGTMTVTDANGQELNTGDTVASGSTVNISVVPVEGKVPTAKYNGSNTIALTENNGTYTGSFVMPTKGTALEINSEPSEYDFGDGD